MQIDDKETTIHIEWDGPCPYGEIGSMATARTLDVNISAVKLAGPPPQSSTPPDKSFARRLNISSYSLRERPQGTI